MPLLSCEWPSFSISEEEITVDYSMSLTASDTEEWVCSGEEPEALPLLQSARQSMDSELIRILFKAAEDLSLEWSALEEPSHGLTPTAHSVLVSS